jgi:hypothetical protein
MGAAALHILYTIWRAIACYCTISITPDPNPHLTSPCAKFRNAYGYGKCTIVSRNRIVSIEMRYILDSLRIHPESRKYCAFR